MTMQKDGKEERKINKSRKYNTDFDETARGEDPSPRRQINKTKLEAARTVTGVSKEHVSAKNEINEVNLKLEGFTDARSSRKGVTYPSRSLRNTNRNDKNDQGLSVSLPNRSATKDYFSVSMSQNERKPGRKEVSDHSKEDGENDSVDVCTESLDSKNAEDMPRGFGTQELNTRQSTQSKEYHQFAESSVKSEMKTIRAKSQSDMPKTHKTTDLKDRDDPAYKRKEDRGNKKEVIGRGHNSGLMLVDKHSPSKSQTLVGAAEAKRLDYLRQTVPSKLPSSELASLEGFQAEAAKRQQTEVQMNSNGERTDSDAYIPEAPCAICEKSAVVYCMECEYYMCQRCEMFHDKETPLKSKHKKLTGESLPGFYTVKQFSQLNQNVKCPVHRTKDAKGFCEEHVILLCDQCMEQNHSCCSLQSMDTLLITDVKKLKQDILQEAKTKLNSLIKVREKLISNKTSTSAREQRIIAEIKEHSEYMIGHIKKLEEQLLCRVRELFDIDTKQLDNNIYQCDASIAGVTSHIQYMDEPKLRKENKLLTVVKLHKIRSQNLTEIDLIERQLNDADRNRTEFISNEKLLRDITTATNLGSIEREVRRSSISSTLDNMLGDLTTHETEFSSCSEEYFPTLDLNGLELSDVRTFSCWTEGDFCSSTTVTAIELLDDHSLLLSDQQNHKLKWFDTEFNVKAYLNLSSEPWGITKLSESQVIVSLPSEQAFVVIKLSAEMEKLEVETKVYLEYEFVCAIKTDSGKLLFAGFDGDEPRIILTDTNGANRNEFFDEQNIVKFKRPNHMVKSSVRTNVAFISDVDRGIFAVDTGNRRILFHYTNPRLKCCMGITLNEDDDIVVCSQQTNSLHIISSVDGSNLCVVPVDYKRPQTVCYLPYLGEYLLTTGENYSLIKFKLE